MYKPNEVVDYIANFTSHRDKELLTFSLLKSINNMIACSYAEIVSINKAGIVVSQITFDNGNYRVKKNTAHVSDEIHHTFQRMNELSLDEYSLKTDAGYSLIKLLHHDRKSEEFLVIRLDKKLGKIQSYILSGILNIYDNFCSLLLESQTDELTGLANRKTFDSSISKIFTQSMYNNETIDNERREGLTSAQKTKKRIWLAIIDIDNFKLVNDRFGHLYGDEILINLAQLIKINFRQEDLQFRFGGEEFVILLNADAKTRCLEILERFRAQVENYNFPKVDTVTVSIGVVEFKQGTFHVTSIDYADQALYTSKRKGKNRITFFEDMLANGEAQESDIEEGDIDLF